MASGGAGINENGDGVKISVTPEGRPELWLAERESLKAWIEAQGFEEIHNFGAAGPMVIGADHDVESVLADIDDAERVAILMGDARRGNMGHALALILPPSRGLPERLEMYDIGNVADDDLVVAVRRRVRDLTDEERARWAEAAEEHRRG